MSYIEKAGTAVSEILVESVFTLAFFRIFLLQAKIFVWVIELPYFYGIIFLKPYNY